MPARVRFLSIEPMLGPINLDRIYLDLSHTAWIDWVICGGESGHGAPPMHPDWARALRDQCAAAGVLFLFKQWGEWEIATVENGHYDGDMARNNAHWVHLDGVMAKPSLLRPGYPHADMAYGMVKVGKKASGRLLDGRTHNQCPERDDPTRCRPWSLPLRATRASRCIPEPQSQKDHL
ncbi:hypothetical protein PPGU19_082290 (plasmid) [Paraburkholderia sp. PGU19]|nr:hypothetical protein PPGU19_082290 [Paraburkholderia sp. PGU19]